MEILDLLRVMSDNDKTIISTIEDFKEQSIKGGIGMGNVIREWIDNQSQKKVEEAAINLLRMKLGTPEQIAQAQGLTLERVQELKEKLNHEPA